MSISFSKDSLVLKSELIKYESCEPTQLGVRVVCCCIGKFSHSSERSPETPCDLFFQLYSVLRKMGCVNGKSVGLSEEDLDFIAAHTAATREEVGRAHENFISRHPDGKIGRREFTRMMRQCYPNADTDKMEKHIFRMYDANSDGDIDFR